MLASNFLKHHIDTSVLVEPENTEDGRICKRYLQKINYNFYGVLSFPVLGELFMILSKFEDFNDRYDFIESVLATIRSRDIKFYAARNIGNLLNNIEAIDSRIDYTDMEIMACACEDACHSLVTLDKDMLNNKKLETFLGIKILHPREFL